MPATITEHKAKCIREYPISYPISLSSSFLACSHQISICQKHSLLFIFFLFLITNKTLHILLLICDNIKKSSSYHLNNFSKSSCKQISILYACNRLHFITKTNFGFWLRCYLPPQFENVVWQWRYRV